MSRQSSIESMIESRRAGVDALRNQVATIDQIVTMMEAAFRSGGKLLTCGNGGSAAEALHLAEELVGRFKRNRDPLAAVCLAADPTALTCIANDYGFEQVFARQVQAIGRAGDVLVVLSTSGKSANLIKALEAARIAGMQTIGLLGPAGSPAEALCDVAFTPDVGDSAIVQELHLTTIHLVLEVLDAAFV